MNIQKIPTQKYTQVYVELEEKINQLMTKSGIDFTTICQVLNNLNKELTCEAAERYP